LVTQLHLHLLSDSTGETLDMVANACLAQFDEIAAIRAAMRSATASGPLKVLAGLSGPKPLAAGDGTLWTVVLHGDLVVAGYDADGRSAAQVARFLRTVHG
jgi:hypothetical protein